MEWYKKDKNVFSHLVWVGTRRYGVQEEAIIVGRLTFFTWAQGPNQKSKIFVSIFYFEN